MTEAAHTRAAAPASSYAGEELLLRLERAVRAHPLVVGVLATLGVAAVATGKLVTHSTIAHALTFGVPLAIGTYGAGAPLGTVLAVAAGFVWVLDGLQTDIATAEAAQVALVHTLTGIGIVIVAAVGRAAAEAREGYLARQEDLNRLQADLVAAFAHDLREPLGSIVGYADLLYDRLAPHDRSTGEQLDRILANAMRLNGLIGDLLTAEQASHKAAVDATEFSPEHLVAEVASDIERTSLNPAVAVHWSIDPGTPAFHTDRIKLLSVIRNLVNNALKFTATGRVTTRVGHRDGRHCIEVEDTGPGIPADLLPHIFDRYYRGRGGRPGSGFGLGLFIVKRFVDILGGTVTVDSAVGAGTRFLVTIPSYRKPAPPAPPSWGGETLDVDRSRSAPAPGETG